MHLFPSLLKRYSNEQYSARQAQRLAQEIAFAPMVFQVCRLMLKWGIFKLLSDSREGLTQTEIAEKCGISQYSAQVLLESSLSTGTVLVEGDRYLLAKTGWFLLNDPMAQINLNFNHDVNYLGLFYLEQALLNGKPDGLRVFGNWETIYEGLAQLPANVQKSWFDFDHFYSDSAFEEALKMVFARPTATLLDVGGNTGRWALKCVAYDSKVKVTVADLPAQLETMHKQTADKEGSDRIGAYPVNLLDESAKLPAGFDAIWLSQFLDCFSESEIISILKRASAAMDSGSRLYIMETFWDRQKYETAAYCLTQISLYFTAMANGNSKMYHSADMLRCIAEAGLQVEQINDHLGLGHSLVVCRK